MSERRAGRSKGSILLSSLWIVIILALVSMGLMRRSMMESRLFQNFGDQEKARALAWTGIRLAVARMESDDNIYDTRYECGIELRENETPESAYGWSSEDGILRVGFEDGVLPRAGLRDEDGKLNLNAAPETLLADLLVRIDAARDSQARHIAALIVERRSGDRGRPFRLLEELLSLHAVTPEFIEAIRPYVTIHGEHNLRLNVHTAPRAVLESAAVFAGMTDEGAREIAEEIIRARQGKDGKEGTPDDVALAAKGVPHYPWITRMSSARPEETEAMFRFLDYLKLESSYFNIRSKGRAGSNTRVTLDAVFFRSRGCSPNLVAFHES